MTRSIVILHPGALGDVLLAVSAIGRLRAQYPFHETLLIAREPVGRLLVACGVINEAMALEGPASIGLFSGPALLSQELQGWFTRCDLAAGWMEDHDGALRSVFETFRIARVMVQSPFSPALHARHQRDRFLETLGMESAVSSEHVIQVPQSLIQKGVAYLESVGVPHGRSFAIVHPGSGSIHKCLSSERVVSILRLLEGKGFSPILLEGPADHESVGRVLKLVRNKPTILQSPDLTTLAGILAQATVYLGHDSGVTHLAAILGIRTIAIFGPTDPLRWAPSGSHVTILRGAPCNCVSWEAVGQCLEKSCLRVPHDQILAALEA